MILALILGLGAGAGLTTALFALAPTPPPLGAALAELHRPRRPALSEVPAGPQLTAGLARTLGLARFVGVGQQADLAITGHDESWYLSWALLLGLTGLATGPVIALLALGLGVSVPWLVVAAMSILAGPGASAGHILSLRSEATRRRADFSFALSAYLDLVVVGMAAGRGIEGALAGASESGSGFAFETLRRAFAAARLRGIPPWDALDELGEQLGIGELCGLAASIRLAGSSGAKVRASVAARAKSLRVRGLADARAAAESATERMSIPVVLLVLGFMVLIGYPAVAQIATQL